MNDLKIMEDMFERAKGKGFDVKWEVYTNQEHTETYICLFKQKFTFNSNGELIKSQPTSLNELYY